MTFSGEMPPGAPFYAATSFWNRKLDASVPVVAPWPHVADVVNYGRQPSDQCAGVGANAFTFGNYPGTGYGPYNRKYATKFGMTDYSVPIYCVDPERDRPAKVGIIHHQTPPTPNNPANIQSYFNEVPWPDITKCPRLDGTKPAGTTMSNLAADGTDKDICLLDLKGDRCWELWVAEGGNNPWTAAQQLWTPAADWTAGNAGYFGPETVPLSQSNGIVPNGSNAQGSWGIRATGLGILGGLITLQDLRNVFYGGTINHAIALAMPITTGTFAAPAVRGDGTHGGGNWIQTIPTGQNFPGEGGPNPAYAHDATPEGYRATFQGADPAACTMPLARELTRAAIEYGIILVDTAGCAQFYVEDPRTLGSIYHINGPDAIDPLALPWAEIQPPGLSGDPSTSPFWDGDGNPITWQMPWSQTVRVATVTS